MGLAPTPAAVAAAVLLTRLPFLGPGYGTDNDAWVVVASGRHLAATGEYVVSRYPGFPLHEIVVALLQRGGPWAVNGASAVAAALAAWLLASLLRRAGVRDWALGALAFAFVPAVFIGSVSGMDYLWAGALVLLALSAALDGRSATAGITLGLAAGCRITSLAAVLPAALALLARRPPSRLRALAALAVPALLVTAAAYLPVWLRYGLGSLSYYEPAGGHSRSLLDFLAGLATPWRFHFPPLFVAGIATVGVWGLLGSAALVIVLAIGALRRGRDPEPGGGVAPVSTPGLIAAAWTAVGVGVLLFLRLPDDEGYLIPVVPFALLLLARALPRRLFRALCVALVFSPFVLGVDAEPPKKGVTPEARSPLAQRFRLGGREAFVLDPLRGPLTMDRDKRRAQMEILARARARWDRLPRDAAVVAGLLDLPLHVEIRPGSIHTYDILTLADLRRLRAEGRPVYYFPDAPERTARFFGYSLKDEGALPFFGAPPGQPPPS